MLRIQNKIQIFDFFSPLRPPVAKYKKYQTGKDECQKWTKNGICFWIECRNKILAHSGRRILEILKIKKMQSAPYLENVKYCMFVIFLKSKIKFLDSDLFCKVYIVKDRTKIVKIGEKMNSSLELSPGL